MTDQSKRYVSIGRITETVIFHCFLIHRVNVMSVSYFLIRNRKIRERALAARRFDATASKLVHFTVAFRTCVFMCGGCASAELSVRNLQRSMKCIGRYRQV